MAYPLETVLAEKLETVVSRGAANTRLRDYYDIHVLWALKSSEIDIDALGEALVATSSKRGSLDAVQRWDSVLSNVAANDVMQSLWAKYVTLNVYAAGITLNEACQSAKMVLRALSL